MSSPLKLYHHVMDMLKPIAWQGRKETLQTLAFMMTGIFQSRDVRLGRIAGKVPLPIKQDSVEQRFRRWLKNPRIDERVLYRRPAQYPQSHPFLAKTRHSSDLDDVAASRM